MKIFLVSDNDDTLTGMRLSGVEGGVAHTREEIRALMDKALSDSEVAIIAVTELVNQTAPDLIDAVKLNKKLPLIAVIPDRHGSKREKDFITKYVREAIGINI